MLFRSVYLTRPGKDAKDGISASLFYGGRMLFHCFTSNASQFDCDKSYDPFGVYVRLEHNGDFRAAALALKGEGYAKPMEGDETFAPVVYDDPVREYLHDYYRFRYNVILGRYYFARNEEPNNWKLVEDRHLNSLIFEMKDARVKTTPTYLKMAVESNFSDDFNPFIYWYQIGRAHV